MRIIQCKRCGKIIEATGEQAYCEECRKIIKSESVMRTRICKECGIEFTGGPRASYCPECRKERQKKADRERKKRKTSTRPIGGIDTCEICGKEYIVSSGRQKYCKECAENAIKEKVRAHKKIYMQERREINEERKKERKENRKICLICGRAFQAETNTVTCSKECAEKLKKIRQEEADIRRGKRKSPAGGYFGRGNII